MSAMRMSRSGPIGWVDIAAGRYSSGTDCRDPYIDFLNTDDRMTTDL